MTTPSPIIIEKLNEAKKFGMIDAFSWPTTLPPFARLNVIYGRNGSGKTTFSNAFRVASRDENLENIRKELCERSGFSLSFRADGKNKTMEALAADNPVFVFNGGFVSDHVYEGPKGKVTRYSGGGTLGEISNQEIKTLHEDVTADRAALGNAQSKKKSCETSFNKIKKRWSEEFNKNPAVTGLRLTGVKVPTARPAGNPAALRASLDALYKRKLNLKDPQKIEGHLRLLRETIVPDLPKDIAEQLSGLLSGAAPSASADAVEEASRQMAGVSMTHSKSFREWLEDGIDVLHHVHDTGTKSCPLCHSDVSKTLGGLLSRYDAYLRDERSGLRRRITNAAEGLGSIAKDIRALVSSLPGLVLVIEEAAIDSSGPLPDSSDLTRLAVLVDHFQDCLIARANELDRTDWTCLSELPELASLIGRMEAPRQALVARVETAAKALSELRDGDNDCVNQIRSTINDLVGIEFDDAGTGNQIKELAVSDSALAKHEAELPVKEKKLRDLVAQLQLEAKSVNRYLKHLGIHHFEIDIASQERETGNILINFSSSEQADSLKNSLSEGEKTCLAFAYFLSKLDSDLFHDPSLVVRSVVVIDDPVSSLDEERLHSTAQIIARKFKDVGQLFILSHNLQFLRFQSSALPNKERADMYLQKSAGTLLIRELPRALANYATPYYEKLAEVMHYAAACVAGSPPYDEGRKHLPGCVRIVLETFLGFKFCVLQQGSSGQKYLTPGLDKLTARISGKSGSFSSFPAVGAVTHQTVVEILDDIKRLTDSQLHGNHQTVEVFVFISETELAQLCKNALDVIKFFDPFHAQEAEQLLAA